MDTVCGFGPRGRADAVDLLTGTPSAAGVEASESSAHPGPSDGSPANPQLGPTSATPGIGQDLQGVNPHAPAGFSVWTYDVTCNQFDAVAKYWNNLIQNSRLHAVPDFKVLSENCVIEVQKSLVAGGVIGSVGATSPMGLVSTLGSDNRTDVNVPQPPK
jgi:hypothetical protein